MTAPQLTFFCEMDSSALESLFADGTVMRDLQTLQARVSLGLVDLSAERAAVVRRLNEANIPIIAWQLLPQEDGYWYNVTNADKAAARYDAFRAWSAEHRLQWDGIGIDIEPDINDMTRLKQGAVGGVLGGLLRRLVDPGALDLPRRQYADLVARMRADGYRVDSYEFGFLLDEHRVGSTLLQRLLGIVSPPADRTVWMVYSSFVGGYGPAVVWCYAPEMDALAVGSTGGGVEVDGAASGDFHALDWDALRRDLLLARRWVDDIGIFSLEGCARQGMLEQIKTLDWSQRVTPPDPAQQDRVQFVRRAVRSVLWLSKRPAITLAVGLIALWWLMRPRQ